MTKITAPACNTENEKNRENPNTQFTNASSKFGLVIQSQSSPPPPPPPPPFLWGWKKGRGGGASVTCGCICCAVGRQIWQGSCSVSYCFCVLVSSVIRIAPNHDELTTTDKLQKWFFWNRGVCIRNDMSGGAPWLVVTAKSLDCFKSRLASHLQKTN